MNLNVVALVGCLGRDPELKYFDSGSVVGNFSIAVNRPKKDGESVADWFDCKAWGKTAEFLGNYIKKGYRVSIVGRLEQEKWEGKDGEKRSRTVVVVDRLENLTPRDQAAAPAPAPGHGALSTFDADVPF